MHDEVDEVMERPVSDFLIPDVGAICSEAKLGWRPEIHSKSLREEIFSNAAIAEELRHDVLTYYHVYPEPLDPESAILIKFRWLMSQDVAVVERRTGLVYHVHQLANFIVEGDSSADPLHWPHEDLRFALGMRREVNIRVDFVENLVAAVASSGAACLSAWLNELPDPITSALALADGQLGKLWRLRVAAPVQAQICDASLDSMMAAQCT